MAVINGTADNDNLEGTSGNDTLDGLGGSDTMSGGQGNDTYRVDALTDVVVELSSGGTDTIISLVDINGLADNVENGILDANGTNNTYIYGNSLNNRLVGNGRANQLGGGAGRDTMEGGAGNDSYEVNDVGDVVIESAGQGMDSVGSSINYTLGANVENLTLLGAARRGGGNELNNLLIGSDEASGSAGNVLSGEAGNDTLIGGTQSNDTLIGGSGNDIYEIRQSGDVIIEAADGGLDGAASYADYTLSANIEDLSLYEGARIGVGNSSDNTLYGSTEASGADGNRLEGKAGNDFLIDRYGIQTPENDSIDTLVGGSGNDIYMVHRPEDIIIEQAGEGTDEVWSYGDFTLPDQVEDLYLMDIAGKANPVSGTGNALNNIVAGNDSDNALAGGRGNDTLKGYGGDDSYLFNRGDGQDLISAQVDTRPDRLETLVFGSDIAPADVIVRLAGTSLELSVLGTTDKVVIESFYAGQDVTNAANPIQQVVFAASDVTWSAADLIERASSNITGTAANNVLSGSGGADLISGLAGNDTLNGLAGDDTLDGGAGIDSMRGGAGNDIYLVDNAADRAVETAAGDGDDLVLSTASYTLGAHVERLTLLGSANLSAFGNDGANTLIGNDGANVLNGGLGADTMQGGLGNDTYYVDNAGDVVIETPLVVAPSAGTPVQALAPLAEAPAQPDTTLVIGPVITDVDGSGYDSVISSVSFTLGAGVEQLRLTGSTGLYGTGNALDNALYGNTGANVLDGGAGNDYLDGSSGGDTMRGGTGDDTYVVDNIRDVVTEDADSGTDTVISALSWTLGTHIERGLLTGATGLSLTGNEQANVLYGNSGANVLRGLAGDDWLNGNAGADTMYGGMGNDTYIVDNARDVADETGGNGIDTVISSVNFALIGTDIERLQLSGSDAISGVGNALDNQLTGNSARNLLSGGAGADTLTGGGGDDFLIGGTGADVFHFASPAEGGDRISDFVSGTDKIQVLSPNFASLPVGTLASSRFVSGLNPVATGSDAVFLYNTRTGQLSFDANGRAAGGVSAIALLANQPALSAGDIQIVSTGPL
jgi:Ca2+-binding RTX toxin-like protein